MAWNVPLPMAPRRNLHVPLPDDLYRRLQREARRSGVPATAIARSAIQRLLTERRRSALREAIAAYARGAAGSRDDLDADLETAGVERLLSERDAT